MIATEKTATFMISMIAMAEIYHFSEKMVYLSAKGRALLALRRKLRRSFRS